MTRAVRLLFALAIASAWGLTPWSADGEPVWTAHHNVAAITNATPMTVLAANTARRALGLVNLVAAAVECAFDDTAVSSPSAWRLAANGTTGDRVFFLPPPSGAVSCISLTGTGQLQILEGR